MNKGVEWLIIFLGELLIGSIVDNNKEALPNTGWLSLVSVFP